MSSVSVFTNSESPSALHALALQCIEKEGLQTPSLPSFECIVRFALRCADTYDAISNAYPKIDEVLMKDDYSVAEVEAAMNEERETSAFRPTPKLTSIDPDVRELQKVADLPRSVAEQIVTIVKER